MRLTAVRLAMTSLALTTPTPLKRGAFILFEGIDRCGKTTQCQLLVDYLNKTHSCGHAASSAADLIRFPNRTSTIGKLINSYLSSTEASDISDQTIHLLFSANRWEDNNNILTKLHNGVTLVCDRYAYSGVAFTAAKGLDYEWCKSCDKGLPAPDCIIYLDMPVDEAAKVNFLYIFNRSSVLLLFTLYFRGDNLERRDMKKLSSKRLSVRISWS